MINSTKVILWTSGLKRGRNGKSDKKSAANTLQEEKIFLEL